MGEARPRANPRPGPCATGAYDTIAAGIGGSPRTHMSASISTSTPAVVTSVAGTPRTVAIEPHGCKLNQADSARLAAQFLREGFRIVAPHESADVFVLNSCTVTHVADRKARGALRGARRRNPDATVVATGCYAERSPEALRALEDVDMVAGNTAKDKLVRSILEWRGEPPVPCAVGSDEAALGPRMMRTRAAVKIQEGCDQVCAYCIVPKVRGRERSVPPEAIVDEIASYVAAGYREVVLTGTQLGTYGFDLEGTNLSSLINRILNQTTVERLRVSSLQPQEIGPALLELWADRRLCPHFHLPLQSGSDAVLRRMRRRYTAAQYIAAADLIRERVPGASITADAIVGFPSETPDDFEQTMRVSRRTALAGMHVFPYSSRPGTSAAHYVEGVEASVRAERVSMLMALAGELRGIHRNALIGETRPVLWEEKREGTRWVGLTDNYVRVECESARPLANQITTATLLAVRGDVMLARAL